MTGGEIDGVTYLENDWAVYDGTQFNKISNAEFITSYNDRTGDIIACPDAALCPATYDYSWENIVTGNDATKESLDKFEDVEYTLGTTEDDLKMLLAWDADLNKWVAKTDREGLSTDPVKDDFSTGLNSQEKAVTNIDIQSVEFAHIRDQVNNFNNDFVQLDSNPVSITNSLSFDPAGSHTITGISQIINPSDDTNRFTPNELSNTCSSLNAELFETTFTDENLANENSPRLLNANKAFVILKPENLKGDIAAQMYDPAKIRTLQLTGFETSEADYDLNAHNPDHPNFDPENPNSDGWGTPFIEVFNKLAGKVQSYLNTESSGSESASNGSLGASGTLEIDNSKNGKTIFIDQSSEFTLMNSINNDFEITFKRVDGDGIDPDAVNIIIQNEGNIRIDGKARIQLAKNYTSVTLKKI